MAEGSTPHRGETGRGDSEVNRGAEILKGVIEEGRSQVWWRGRAGCHPRTGESENVIVTEDIADCR